MSVNKVIITSNLYLPNIGGIENSLKSLAVEGSKLGDDVKIIASNIVDAENKTPPKFERADGFEIHRYNAPRAGGKLTRVVAHIFNAYKTYHEHYDPKTLVIARYHWNVIFLFLAGFRNITYVIPGVVAEQNNSLNISNFNKFSYFFEKTVQKLAIRLSRTNVVFSELMFDSVKKLTKSDIKIVNPGVDLNRFNIKLRREIFVRTTDFVVLLIVSRLVKAKGIEYAIESLVYLPSNYILKIAGIGPDYESLYLLACRLGVEDRVEFLGKILEPEKLYIKADIFLLPSLYEPFGQTILEASASGLPVVAFDSNIVRTSTNFILKEFAFYSNELDARSYAKAIELAYIAIENKCFNVVNIFNHIENGYSWSRLYKELTKN